MNFQDIIGLPVEIVERKVKNFRVRFVKENGLMTCDFDPDRLTLIVENGLVKKVLGVG
jgi:hypothetical protein